MAAPQRVTTESIHFSLCVAAYPIRTDSLLAADDTVAAAAAAVGNVWATQEATESAVALLAALLRERKLVRRLYLRGKTLSSRLLSCCSWESGSGAACVLQGLHSVVKVVGAAGGPFPGECVSGVGRADGEWM
eukprot:scaffold111187_cov17-Tisochrysis_lutea.AAC.1